MSLFFLGVGSVVVGALLVLVLWYLFNKFIYYPSSVSGMAKKAAEDSVVGDDERFLRLRFKDFLSGQDLNSLTFVCLEGRLFQVELHSDVVLPLPHSHEVTSSSSPVPPPPPSPRPKQPVEELYE